MFDCFEQGRAGIGLEEDVVFFGLHDGHNGTLKLMVASLEAGCVVATRSVANRADRCFYPVTARGHSGQ
jgi:hypothetical protein